MSANKQGRRREDDVRCFECCECCHKEPHKPCEDHHKPCEDHHKECKKECPKECQKESAQFTNDNKQKLKDKGPKAIEFTSVPVPDRRDIKLFGTESIFLEPGRYLVDYFLDLDNDNENDDVQVFAQLKLNSTILGYTTGRALLGEQDDDEDDEDTLTKTNLVDVHVRSELKLIVTSDDNNADVEIHHASIVIVAI